jgi:hypothetical protein
MERCETAHRDSDNVRSLEAKTIEDREDIVARPILRVAGRLRGNVGRRVAARVIGDASVAPGEVTHLRFIAAAVAGELMHKDHRLARARVLIVEFHAIVSGNVGHGMTSRRLALARRKRPGGITGTGACQNQ